MRALASRHGRRIGAALALAAVRVATLGVVGTNSPRAPGFSSPDASKPGIAAVDWRDLLETDTESGALSYTRLAHRPQPPVGDDQVAARVGQLIKHHDATRDHRAE